MTEVRETVSLEAFRESVGAAPTCSEWVTVDQALIDDFARVTGDDAFIHVDPERARATRFKGTIAHGLLTLSLLPLLMRSATPLVEGARMGVNYGFDRVRFLAPVPVGSRVRARVTLAEITEPKPSFLRLAYDVVVDIEGSEEPALAARWLLGRWFDGKTAVALEVEGKGA